MASLAAVFSKYFLRGVNPAQQQAAEQENGPRLRPFPNEDIYFYVKRIDNSRVARAADPSSRRAAWKTAAAAAAAAAMIISVVVPSGYGLLAGYEIEDLRREAQRLASERAALELEEAALLSPARMQELARLQHFIDPAPERVVYLGAPGDTELAGVAPAADEVK